ncbi:MAG: hypothetical protein ACR2GL_02490, partial [Thermoleophilaceae bacterium]
ALRRERAGRDRSRGRAAPAAPRRRARGSIADRPPPLWGAFPLTELITLAGIALMAWGFLAGAGRDQNAKIAAGLAIASIAGLELAVREHVTGFRSHTTLLSGAVAIVTILVLGLGAGLETLGLLLGAGLAAFAGSFVGLRGLFRRRSGGLSFR